MLLLDWQSVDKINLWEYYSEESNYIQRFFFPRALRDAFRDLKPASHRFYEIYFQYEWMLLKTQSRSYANFLSSDLLATCRILHAKQLLTAETYDAIIHFKGDLARLNSIQGLLKKISTAEAVHLLFESEIAISREQADPIQLLRDYYASLNFIQRLFFPKVLHDAFRVNPARLDNDVFKAIFNYEDRNGRLFKWLFPQFHTLFQSLLTDAHRLAHSNGVWLYRQGFWYIDPLKDVTSLVGLFQREKELALRIDARDVDVPRRATKEPAIVNSRVKTNDFDRPLTESLQVAHTNPFMELYSYYSAHPITRFFLPRKIKQCLQPKSPTNEYGMWFVYRALLPFSTSSEGRFLAVRIFMQHPLIRIMAFGDFVINSLPTYRAPVDIAALLTIPDGILESRARCLDLLQQSPISPAQAELAFRSSLGVAKGNIDGAEQALILLRNAHLLGPNNIVSSFLRGATNTDTWASRAVILNLANNANLLNDIHLRQLFWSDLEGCVVADTSKTMTIMKHLNNIGILSDRTTASLHFDALFNRVSNQNDLYRILCLWDQYALFGKDNHENRARFYSLSSKPDILFETWRQIFDKHDLASDFDAFQREIVRRGYPEGRNSYIPLAQLHVRLRTKDFSLTTTQACYPRGDTKGLDELFIVLEKLDLLVANTDGTSTYNIAKIVKVCCEVYDFTFAQMTNILQTLHTIGYLDSNISENGDRFKSILNKDIRWLERFHTIVYYLQNGELDRRVISEIRLNALLTCKAEVLRFVVRMLPYCLINNPRAENNIDDLLTYAPQLYLDDLLWKQDEYFGALVRQDYFDELIQIAKTYPFPSEEGKTALQVKMLEIPEILNYAEKHTFEYDAILKTFLLDTLSIMRANPRLFIRNELTYYLIRNIIRRYPNLPDGLSLSDAEYIKDRNDPYLTHENIAELRTLNHNIPQAWLATFLELESRIPYRATPRETISVVIDNHTESSMQALSVNQVAALSQAHLHYDEQIFHMGGGAAVLTHLRDYLIYNYHQNPATIMISQVQIRLPLLWDEFIGLGLEGKEYERALRAYYRHSTHSAWRYLLDENQWMSENPTMPTLHRRSSYVSHLDTLGLCWMGVQDKDMPCTDDDTLETRIERFIRELASLCRAHNQDKYSVRVKQPQKTLYLGSPDAAAAQKLAPTYILDQGHLNALENTDEHTEITITDSREFYDVLTELQARRGQAEPIVYLNEDDENALIVVNTSYSARRISEGDLEEFDNLLGDDPSCEAGILQRLLQASEANPLFNILTWTRVQQYLHEFVRKFFVKTIRPDNQAELRSAYQQRISSGGVHPALLLLNIPEAIQQQFITVLRNKFKESFTEVLEKRVIAAFKLQAADDYHAASFASATSLENLLSRPLLESTTREIGLFARSAPNAIVATRPGVMTHDIDVLESTHVHPK